MNRRTLFRSAAALLGVSAAGGTVAARNGRNRYYDGPVSDHFDGVRFYNPEGQVPKGFRDLMRWRFGPKPAEWPDEVALSGSTRPAERVQDMTVTMVGHATLLIQTAGLNILTDPFWSGRASPMTFAGPKRVVAPGVAFADLPPIDVVLLSHNHYDHLDIATLRRLKAAHDPLVIAPLGNDALVAPTGLRCQTVDWGHSVEAGPLTVHCTPCHHWSARGVGDRSMALWGGFVVTGPAGTILHIGDTGFDGGRPYRGLDRFGPLRLAILPIGAYEPRWFMRDQHQNPDEAVQGLLLSGAAYAIGHHWGTIQLTDEARTAPLTALQEALERHAVAPDRFRAQAPGDTWDVPPITT
ncbi:MBL fold metallo-hydrolase [Sagittula sp. MA-2]|uniref:MBL fold metallo-hydrolase n=1 Tax=Sagittula sp. MA-2 TaxID=3048007 RepID=UPI0024C2CB0E|nr:MBL fold metallo-hydrolase [Sagittula sp. MA-2]WHZ35928.1 MBL fold metallo-hydrolase [Sagittula sp. MA-2]